MKAPELAGLSLQLESIGGVGAAGGEVVGTADQPPASASAVLLATSEAHARGDARTADAPQREIAPRLDLAELEARSAA